mmetsp:Transcript_33346/g.105392  ORF Transcript_33346/g.105392 Transcript_33346/m.105392 type:complete len:218 (+) Transcript_33346:96-749(+)
MSRDSRFISARRPMKSVYPMPQSRGAQARAARPSPKAAAQFVKPLVWSSRQARTSGLRKPSMPRGVNPVASTSASTSSSWPSPSVSRRKGKRAAAPRSRVWRPRRSTARTLSTVPLSPGPRMRIQPRFVRSSTPMSMIGARPRCRTSSTTPVSRRVMLYADKSPMRTGCRYGPSPSTQSTGMLLIRLYNRPNMPESQRGTMCTGERASTSTHAAPCS